MVDQKQIAMDKSRLKVPLLQESDGVRLDREATSIQVPGAGYSQPDLYEGSSSSPGPTTTLNGERREVDLGGGLGVEVARTESGISRTSDDENDGVDGKDDSLKKGGTVFHKFFSKVWTEHSQILPEPYNPGEKRVAQHFTHYPVG